MQTFLGAGCKHGVLLAMWKLWIASFYSHCSLWRQVPGCPHDVMDKLLNLTDKLRSSKDPTVCWCFLVFNLLGFSPSLYTETMYERVRANFWTGELFICATRLQGTVQILLLYCLHESVQIFCSVSIRMDFFYPKRVTTTLVKTSWDTWGNLALRLTLLNNSFFSS